MSSPEGLSPKACAKGESLAQGGTGSFLSDLNPQDLFSLAVHFLRLLAVGCRDGATRPLYCSSERFGGQNYRIVLDLVSGIVGRGSMSLKQAVGPRNTRKDAKKKLIVEDRRFTDQVRTASGLTASFRVL